jgi:hypothetical protein
VVLARAINEDKLMALEGRSCPATVVSLLRSFDTLGFWPDCTEALFVVADARSQDFNEEERYEEVAQQCSLLECSTLMG